MHFSLGSESFLDLQGITSNTMLQNFSAKREGLPPDSATFFLQTKFLQRELLEFLGSFSTTPSDLHCLIFSLQDVCVVALHPSWCVIRYVQSQKYTTNTIKQIFLPNGAGLLITSVIEALVCCLSHPPIIHAATSAVIVGHHAFSGHLHCLDGRQWQSL